MSQHPNVILLLELTPDDLVNKTLRALKAQYVSTWTDAEGTIHESVGEDIAIGSAKYHIQTAESDYLEDYQIATEEGRIVVFDMVTYGYGEKILWADLIEQQADLEVWAKMVCERYNCSEYEISITANYW